MASIFLSYARVDAAAVALLHQALTDREHKLWIDVQDLPEASPWREDIVRAIDRSDVFVFVVSQASLRSVECRKEFEHARDRRKRIVPIVLDDTQPSAAPPDLADIGWIPATAHERIHGAIGTDLAHLERHTRFLLDALDWKQRRGGVLRGATLREAQQWLADAAARKLEPVPASEHRELIAASVRARRNRRIAAVVMTVVVVAVVGYYFLVARERARIARANELANEFEQLWKRRELDTAMLRAVEAYRTAPTIAATGALIRAVQNDPWLEVMLRGGDGEVDAVAFAPSGKELAIGRDDGVIELWNTRTWVRERTILTGTERVAALAYSPDGKVLVGGDWSSRIRRWKADGVGEIGTPLHAERGLVEEIALHPGGRYLAVAYATGAMLWDLGLSTPTATPVPIDPSRRSSAVTFASDGAILAAVEGTETLHVWDFRDGLLSNERTRTFGSGVTALAAHGSVIVAGLADGTAVRIYAPDLSELRRTPLHSGPILGLAFNGTGEVLASAGGDARAHIVREDDPPVAFETPARVFDVAFDRTSSRLALAGANGTAYVLDVAHRQPLAQVVRREREGIQQIAFDAKGNVVASTEDSLFPEGLTGVALADMMDATVSADGNRLAAGDNKGTIGLWDAKSKRFLRSWKTPEAIADLAFSANGQTLASVNSANAEITLIDVDEAAILATFKGTCSRVFSVVFLGEQLVTGCNDGSIELLDVRERVSIARMPDHEDEIDFVNVLTVRGRRVAAGLADGRVMLWNLDSQWWLRRACHRSNRDDGACAPLSGQPAEIPSSTPPRDNKAIPDGRDLPSIVAGWIHAVPNPAPPRR